MDSRMLALLTPRDIERFWRKVNKTDTCWLWTDTPTSGYGNFAFARTSTSSHRVAYTLLIGLIPEGLHLDHLCKVRLCCNPAHLEPVTPLENRRRSLPTVCKRGHDLTPENTGFSKPNRRRCLTCSRRANREAMARARAKQRAS